MGALIWVALDLRRLAATGEDRPSRLTGRPLATLAVLFVQLLYGAWVAGLDAGQVANDWPLMQGRFFPDGIDWSQRRCLRARQRPVPRPFHPPLVGMGRGRRAGRLRAAGPHGARRAAGLDRHPCGVRDPDPARHPTVLTGVAIWLAALHQAVGALRRRRNRLGRTCSGGQRDERRLRLRGLRQCRRGRAHRPGSGRGAPRRLHQHPRPLPLDLPLAGRGRERRRGRPQSSRPTSEQADALIARIAELHSYEVPCIVVWPVDKLLRSYADWVEDSSR